MDETLKNIKLGRIEKLPDDLKLLFYEREGLVAIETWANGKDLKMKYIRISSVRNYLLNLGEFKEVAEKMIDISSEQEGAKK